MRVTTRLITLDDADALAALVAANREFMAPWDPVRPEEYYTLDGQAAVLRTALASHGRGAMLPHVICVDGEVAGRVNLNDVVQGAFQNGNLGYWVDQSRNGRGVATAAVESILHIAFTELGLHRVQAGTLPGNIGSQRVLERNGFERFGYAPQYLNIAGAWQDHVLFQRINPAA
nr:GNAT family protein [Longispora albida]